MWVGWGIEFVEKKKRKKTGWFLVSQIIENDIEGGGIGGHRTQLGSPVVVRRTAGDSLPRKKAPQISDRMSFYGTSNPQKKKHGGKKRERGES